MARYTGPKHRICRIYGEKLCDSPKCPATRRPYRPGQHGPQSRQRLTEYGIQLKEKQKAAGLYGILERQFRNYVSKAKKTKGNAGSILVQLLETRLDNVVYRLRFAPSRQAARQAVSHGHVMVNGKKVDIPSYQVSPGDTVQISDKHRQSKRYNEVAKSIQEKDIPGWLALENQEALKGSMTGTPLDADLDQGFDTSLIIEFYSR